VNVLHINTFDTVGGAAKAAYRLHEGLIASGASSKMLCHKKSSMDPNVSEITRSSLHGRLIEITCRHFTKKYGFQYQYIPSTFRMRKWESVRNADVLHLHNLHGVVPFFAITALGSITRNTPAVWTLHDMWAVTGHCAVAAYNECERWMTGCGSCPQLGDYPRLTRDRTAYLWKKKKKIYRNWESNGTSA
jgi:glycosyltransferase involved in cell wall biosynthesis